MDLADIVRAALDYEHKVCDVYQRAANSPEVRNGREFFQMMADEEQGHVEYLEALLGRVQRDEGWRTSVVPVRLPDAAFFEDRRRTLAVDPASGAPHPSAAVVELRLLEEALEVEEATSAFYAEMVERCDDETQELFDRFLEIETSHRAFVQLQIDMLLGTGEWFTLENEADV